MVEVPQDLARCIKESNEYPDTVLEVHLTLDELSKENIADLKEKGFNITHQLHNVPAVFAEIKPYHRAKKWLEILANLDYVQKVSIAYDMEALAG